MAAVVASCDSGSGAHPVTDAGAGGGGSGGVDYTDPSEQAAQAEWAASLLDAYPEADGVLFDYVRYLEWEPIDADNMGDSRHAGSRPAATTHRREGCLTQ